VFKNAKQHVFVANTPKKAKNMPNYDIHTKQHFLMPIHF